MAAPVPLWTPPYSTEALMAKARSRADLVGNQFITDDELVEMLNVGWARLYGLLVTLYEDFFEAPTFTFVTTAAQQIYDLTAGAGVLPVGAAPVWKVRGVDLQLSGANGDVLPLPRFEWSERGKYVGMPNAWVGRYSSELRYNYRKQSLYFVPPPQGGQSVTLHYVPKKPLLVTAAVFNGGNTPTNSANTLPEVVQDGWEEVIVLEAALIMAAKEEGMAGNIPILKSRLDERKAEIEAEAANRDVDAPLRMTRRADQMRTWWSDNDGGEW